MLWSIRRHTQDAAQLSVTSPEKIKIGTLYNCPSRSRILLLFFSLAVFVRTAVVIILEIRSLSNPGGRKCEAVFPGLGFRSLPYGRPEFSL